MNPNGVNSVVLIKANNEFRLFAGMRRIAIALYLRMKKIPAYIMTHKFNFLNSENLIFSLAYWEDYIKENEEGYLKNIKNVYVGAAAYAPHTDIEKINIVQNAVLDLNPKTLIDLGCNSGRVSQSLTKKNINVLGIDICTKEELHIPDDYKYIQQDIIKTKFTHSADVILFLSVYHHLVYNLGVKGADKIFFNILNKCRYLIFDTGTPEEKGLYQRNWSDTLNKYFNSEKELLDHFRLEYKILGSWLSKGKKRTIILFNGK